jgi:hypothetical protein
VAGLGVVTWRYTRVSHRLIPPGVLLGITGLFAALGLLADYPPATGFAVALGWGLDVAALMNVLPAGLAGQVGTAQKSEAKATGQPAPQGA